MENSPASIGHAFPPAGLEPVAVPDEGKACARVLVFLRAFLPRWHSKPSPPMTFFGVIPECFRQVVILLAHTRGRTVTGIARTFGRRKEWHT